MVARETSISSALAGSRLLPDDPGESEEAIRRLETFAELLRDVAIPRGFLGPAEGGRVVGRHVLESVGLSAVVPPDGLLIDVGSGAGLPGVVLAVLRSSPVVLIEAQARRAAFLREVSAAIGTTYDVVHARAEDAARSDLRETAATVVARALAEPAVALELT